MPTNGFVSREDDCDSHVWLSREATIVKTTGSWCQQGNVHSVQRVHRFQIITSSPSSPSSPSTHTGRAKFRKVPVGDLHRSASIRGVGLEWLKWSWVSWTSWTCKLRVELSRANQGKIANRQSRYIRSCPFSMPTTSGV